MLYLGRFGLGSLFSRNWFLWLLLLRHRNRFVLSFSSLLCLSLPSASATRAYSSLPCTRRRLRFSSWVAGTGGCPFLVSLSFPCPSTCLIPFFIAGPSSTSRLSILILFCSPAGNSLLISMAACLLLLLSLFVLLFRSFLLSLPPFIFPLLFLVVFH